MTPPNVKVEAGQRWVRKSLSGPDMDITVIDVAGNHAVLRVTKAHPFYLSLDTLLHDYRLAEDRLTLRPHD